VGLADIGRTVTVTVTGSKPGYHAVSRTSAGTSAQARSIADTACTVTLTGKAKVGKKLKAHVTGCPAGASLHYAWYAGSKQISGADGAAYKLKRRQARKKIKVLVSVSAPGYLAVTRTSPQTGKVKR
jgi:hypothetical protein